MEVPMMPRPGGSVNRGPRPSKSAAILAQDWPLVLAAARETYWPNISFAQVQPDGSCPAGYLLSAVLAMQNLYADRHGHKPVTTSQCDRAAARELRYHFSRGRRFNRPEAALYRSLLNLVIERPERFQGGH